MMYTMPKNFLSVCVNFTLATQHFSAIYCNYAKRPRYRSLSIIALTDHTSVQWLQWPARRYNRRPDEIRYSPRPS